MHVSNITSFYFGFSELINIISPLCRRKVVHKTNQNESILHSKVSLNDKKSKEILFTNICLTFFLSLLVKYLICSYSKMIIHDQTNDLLSLYVVIEPSVFQNSGNR